MSKCVKADGSEPTEIEASVATELKNLEQGSSEIKVELRELTFLSAREVDVGGGKKAYIANYMFPEGRTCSGDKEVLAKACELATKAGAKAAKMLAVSGAFHTPYMAAAGVCATVFIACIARHRANKLDARPYEQYDSYNERRPLLG